MTQEFFQDQVKRLKMRFGEKAFDSEIVQLIGREVISMTREDFMRVVDVMIGQRAANKPPLVSDFREARLAQEKYKFNRVVQEAVSPSNWQNGLQAVLDRDYPGCKTLSEAVELQKLRNQIARAKGAE